MMHFSLRTVLAVALSLLPLSLGDALAQTTSVRFGTNWVAQAEHGGFYQAVADGTYEKFGLQVEIVPGGPAQDNRLRLLSGGLDFFMGGNISQGILAIEQGIPLIAVAAMFQKEPQILMSHPGVGFDRFEDLKKSKKSSFHLPQSMCTTSGLQSDTALPLSRQGLTTSIPASSSPIQPQFSRVI